MSWVFDLAVLGLVVAGGAWLWRNRNNVSYQDTSSEDARRGAYAGSASQAPRARRERHGAAVSEETSQRQMDGIVEEMAGEVRTESTNHGIIILRWLKNLKFSDKSLQEVLEAGNSEDREELRGLVAHVVQLYQGIMANMIARNPALGAGEHVQRAGNVALNLMHAVKILVALEKPVHMSQSQNIGNDVSQQPENWDTLKDQTVDRLMEILKNALESAFNQQRQHEQDRAEEEAVEQAADSLVAADTMHRTRRRKKKQSALVNAFRKRAKAGDINADGVADHLQGINIQNNSQAIVLETENRLRNLRQQDQEALAAITRALARTGDELRNMPIADGQDKRGGGGPLGLKITDVDPNAPLIGMDGEDVATRLIKQREMQLQQGPKKTF